MYVCQTDVYVRVWTTDLHQVDIRMMFLVCVSVLSVDSSLNPALPYCLCQKNSTQNKKVIHSFLMGPPFYQSDIDSMFLRSSD